MLQFTQQEMMVIRNKMTKSILIRLIQDNRVVLSQDTLIPQDNRATWNLYYFCPEHAVRLDWQWDKPTQHCCPVDGEVFSGEPYDGAWWRGLNGLNAKACYELGLLWQLTQQPQYLEKVKQILLGYARYYPDYEPHGGIPYNGPGKANAQTLCEANCHLDFALGYDFIRNDLTTDEREYIECRLLCEGADFLMQHRSEQLHNHEMKISATIGVIGLIVEQSRYIEFAVNSKYGLKYQLSEGVNAEGMWFEGSIHYHYYALQALLAFEKVAHQTSYSLRYEPNYYKMIAFPLQLMSATGDFPRLNDCIAGQEKLTHSHVFEFAYRQFNDPIFASALATIYKGRARDNIDALLYGVEHLVPEAPLTCNSIHSPVSGLTIMHHAELNNMLLLKHAPYGGEHDHYDRLGLIICRNGIEILPDLGTTGYGAEMHYGYYKNTATHNTLAVNQKNQPPTNSKCLDYQNTPIFTFIDTLVDWSEPTYKLDSHTIVQWDVESYQGVTYRRSILWLNEMVVEVNQVMNPRQNQLDLTWHFRAKLRHVDDSIEVSNPLNGPLQRMKNCRQHALAGLRHYQLSIDRQPDFHYYLYSPYSCEVLTGLAPDNPATQDLAYMMLRSQKTQFKAVAIHDLSLTENFAVESIQWKEDSILIEYVKDDVKQRIRLDFSNENVAIKINQIEGNAKKWGRSSYTE